MAQLAGALLIGAFVILSFAWPFGVPGLYAAENIEEQLRLLVVHRRRWLVTQALVSLYAVLAAAGFAALAIDLSSSVSAWLPGAGAVGIAAGSASGAWFVVLQTKDPRGGYSGRYPLPEVAAYWLWLAGLALIGVALIVAGPTWLGILTAGSTAAFVAFYLITGAGFMTPALTALLGLVIGVVMLLQ